MEFAFFYGTKEVEPSSMKLSDRPADKKSDKLIRMEVQPKHTIGSIIETIVDKQKLDKSQRYKLTLGNQSFGKEQYLLKLKDARISHGDHLFLEAEGVTKPEVKQKEIAETKKKAVTEAKPEQFCMECGSKLTWIQQYQRWYCYKCHKYMEA